MSSFSSGRVTGSNASNNVPSFGKYDSSSFNNQSVSFLSQPLSNDTIDSFNSSLSAFRVIYNPDIDPYSPYNNLRCVIATLGDVRFFIGAFDTDAGDTVPVIQIPFVGQTIKSLCDRISEIPGISVNILNSWDFNSVDDLADSSTINSTNIWGYFFVKNNLLKNAKESFLDRNIKMFYTSIEPSIAQNNYSQSIGGFLSSNQIYSESVLYSDLSFYDKYIILEDDSLSESQYIFVNDEIIEIEKWEGNKGNIKNRNLFDTPIRFHCSGSVVRKYVKENLFDSKFSSDRKQYRCISVKNTSSNGEIAKDVHVYIKMQSRNDLSDYRIAIELPISEYYEGVSQKGSRQYFIDNGLIGSFYDNYYKGCSLTFVSGQNSGQTRIVSDFSKQSGMIIVDKEFPYDIEKDDTYYIDSHPSQRLKSPFDVPLYGSNAESSGLIVSDFYNAIYAENALSINFNNRENKGDLLPNQCFYVWIERSLDSVNKGLKNNRIILSVNYNRV